MFDSIQFINHFPYLGIFLLLILGAMGLPFPEDIILLLSGYLVADNVIKTIPTILVAYLGLLLTDFSLFLTGKKYGRKIVEHKRFRKVISQDKLSKLEEKFKKWGIWVIFLGRHILGLRAQIFIASGLMKMPLMKFIFADGISALFTIGIWEGMGYLGGNSIQGLKKNITSIQNLVVLAFFIFVISGVIFWYLKSSRTSRKK